jgi:hypothetical protein
LYTGPFGKGIFGCSHFLTNDTPTLLLLELDLLDFDENLHPDSGFQEEFNGI